MAAIIIGTIILFSSVVTYWVLDDRRADRINLNKEFAGSITHVEYDEKDFPTIAIGDSSYYIGEGYYADHQIEVGDSIVKKRGSEVYKLIKHGSKKIIEFNK